MEHIPLSTLPKTWLIDIDGTILKHNLEYGQIDDEILEGTKQFWKQHIRDGDTVILLTNRRSDKSEALPAFLKAHGLRYDALMFDLPNGERICINDIKPSSGLRTAVAINVVRNDGLKGFTITQHG